MDDPTDLERSPERTPEEDRAAAGLLDVAAQPLTRRPRAVALDASGRLTGIQHRASRQHRRWLAGRAAIGAAAVAVVALVAPAVLPGGGGGIVAALGLDQLDAAPAPETATAPGPDTPPSPGGPASVPVLTDGEIAAFSADARGNIARGGLVADGALALSREPRSARIGDVGGWCGDTPLSVEFPASESWSVAWRRSGDDAPLGGFSVGERVLSWGAAGPVEPVYGEWARAYVDATATSTLECVAADEGSGSSRTFSVMPEPSSGAVQAVARVQGPQPTWQVRTVAPTAPGDVIDLTVVLQSSTAEAAATAVQPLLQRALDRVALWQTSRQPSAAIPGDPSASASDTVVRPYGAGELTLAQVDALLPGAVSAAPDQGPLGEGQIVVGCRPPFFIPDGATNFEASSQVAFEAPHDGGFVSVTERLLRYEDGTAKDYVSATNDPTTVCDPAVPPSAWRAVLLRHSGKAVEAVVRHPDGDPRRWVVRAAVTADDATAVDLEIAMTASSQAEVAEIAVPLLEAAQDRAYAANFVPSAP